MHAAAFWESSELILMVQSECCVLQHLELKTLSRKEQLSNQSDSVPATLNPSLKWKHWRSSCECISRMYLFIYFYRTNDNWHCFYGCVMDCLIRSPRGIMLHRWQIKQQTDAPSLTVTLLSMALALNILPNLSVSYTAFQSSPVYLTFHALLL